MYYDGTKLLSLKDIDGNTPEIYICTSNRSAGKTTYFSRLCVNRFLDKGEKFMVIYRFSYELDDCAAKFFKDIGDLFFTGHTMTSEKRGRGIYHELYLDNFPCGYAVALNNADAIKKNSHFFSDTARILFDEFQSETNHYCPDEVKKFNSIHTSVARGQSKQVRYVPVYMISNPISIINPYYTAMGISSRLDKKTKFLKGRGFVLEQGFNESSYNAQKESGFNKAFSKLSYNEKMGKGEYLIDNLAFIEKPNGKSTYVCTLKYNGINYAIREFSELGFLYCDTNADITFPTKISVTTDDHDINYVMLKRSDFFLGTLRYFFEKGCFRFKDLNCKEAVIQALSY